MKHLLATLAGIAIACVCWIAYEIHVRFIDARVETALHDIIRSGEFVITSDACSLSFRDTDPLQVRSACRVVVRP